MAQAPVDRNELVQEKRDRARRARRLAQTQTVEADRERLIEFAAELDKEAEAIVQQQQVQQQQQQAADSPQPKEEKERQVAPVNRPSRAAALFESRLGTSPK